MRLIRQQAENKLMRRLEVKSTQRIYYTKMKGSFMTIYW